MEKKFIIIMTTIILLLAITFGVILVLNPINFNLGENLNGNNNRNANENIAGGLTAQNGEEHDDADSVHDENESERPRERVAVTIARLGFEEFLVTQISLPPLPAETRHLYLNRFYRIYRDTPDADELYRVWALGEFIPGPFGGIEFKIEGISPIFMSELERELSRHGAHGILELVDFVPTLDPFVQNDIIRSRYSLSRIRGLLDESETTQRAEGAGHRSLADLYDSFGFVPTPEMLADETMWHSVASSDFPFVHMITIAAFEYYFANKLHPAPIPDNDRWDLITLYHLHMHSNIPRNELNKVWALGQFKTDENRWDRWVFSIDGFPNLEMRELSQLLRERGVAEFFEMLEFSRGLEPHQRRRLDPVQERFDARNT